MFYSSVSTIKLLAAFLWLSSTDALSSTSSSVYNQLASMPLYRASSPNEPTLLPCLWRSNTPFGLGDEVAHAEQLKQRIPSSKLFYVGVGSATAASEFASQLDISPDCVFGDEGGIVGDVLGLKQGMGTMWNPPAVDNMMSRNDETSLKSLGEAYKSAAENIGFKQLAPSQIKDTLRQGGTFCFRGDKLLLEHYDSKVGDNCEIGDILKAIRQAS